MINYGAKLKKKLCNKFNMTKWLLRHPCIFQVVRFGDCVQTGQGYYPKKITSSSGRDMSDSSYV